jgi:hypothetical protein
MGSTKTMKTNRVQTRNYAAFLTDLLRAQEVFKTNFFAPKPGFGE